MNKFIIRDNVMRSGTAQYLTLDTLYNAILENNGCFQIKRNEKEGGYVVYCENKPRNMPVYGIQWEELNA